MKVQVKEKEKKFKPIVLEVTIESEEELCDLWHRMNAVVGSFVSYLFKDSLKYGLIDDTESVLYDILDDFAKKLNLKK